MEGNPDEIVMALQEKGFGDIFSNPVFAYVIGIPTGLI